MTEHEEQSLPDPVPAYCCGDRLLPCIQCGADVWNSLGDSYAWLSEVYTEKFQCTHCGCTIKIELSD